MAPDLALCLPFVTLLCLLLSFRTSTSPFSLFLAPQLTYHILCLLILLEPSPPSPSLPVCPLQHPAAHSSPAKLPSPPVHSLLHTSAYWEVATHRVKLDLRRLSGPRSSLAQTHVNMFFFFFFFYYVCMSVRVCMTAGTNVRACI